MSSVVKLVNTSARSSGISVDHDKPGLLVIKVLDNKIINLHEKLENGFKIIKTYT